MRKQFLVGVISFFAIFKAYSFEVWGPTGHRATGEIAEKYLTRKAKRNINKLLKGQSLAFVSTFADEIKSDKKYNEFYAWHYINMSIDKTYGISVKNKKGDLVTGIQSCIDVLKSKNNSVKEKAFYLKMLVHLLGDLHQPLHIGRKIDKGGNSIRLKWHGEETNLHKVWDENLLDKWGMSYSEIADNTKRLNKNQLNEIQKGTVKDWVHETHELTKRIYSSADTGDNLKYKYSYEYMPVVRQQLHKGGIRLAMILNKIFG
ncbi:S1/P1 nuclease [Tenacibaculum sp. C7A-26P2]|uniref:S1/P1 nuclease n=1 Tax=Tenacibaculum sp. C7A-26P2 TaxID=3447504 RepID=UPI003F826F36